MRPFAARALYRACGLQSSRPAWQSPRQNRSSRSRIWQSCLQSRRFPRPLPWPRQPPHRSGRKPGRAPSCRCRAEAEPCRETIWSDCFGSTPRRNARSMVSLNFAFGNFARTPTASFSGYAFLASTTSSAFLNRLLGICFWCGSCELLALPRLCFLYLTDNFNSHAARRAGNDAERGFFIGRVHVLGLHFDDVQNLFARHFADFVLVRGLLNRR